MCTVSYCTVLNRLHCQAQGRAAATHRLQSELEIIYKVSAAAQAVSGC
jgi:hypothetical protein